MTLRPIEYQADGVRLTGFLADGSKGGPVPGVLVAHESPGVTEHVKERALALSEEGYVAFALDLFGAHDLTLEEARRHSSLVMTTPGLMYAPIKCATAEASRRKPRRSDRREDPDDDWRCRSDCSMCSAGSGTHTPTPESTRMASRVSLTTRGRRADHGR